MSTESSFDTQPANDKKQRYHKSESETWSAAAVTNTPRDHTDESYEQRPMTGAGDIEAQYDQQTRQVSPGAPDCAGPHSCGSDCRFSRHASRGDHALY